jgi:hypothetical protein
MATGDAVVPVEDGDVVNAATSEARTTTSCWAKAYAFEDHKQNFRSRCRIREMSILTAAHSPFAAPQRSLSCLLPTARKRRTPV